MAEPLSSRKTTFWTIYVVIAVIIVFFSYLPLTNGAADAPAPDFMLGFTFAWVLRRPDYVPVALVVAVTLAMDFLLLRPPGLWTALTVMALEFLRGRVQRTPDMTHTAEAIIAGIAICFVIIANRIILSLLLIEIPPIRIDALFLLLTLISYPFVVLFSNITLGLRKTSPGEVDDLGRKL